MIFSIILRFTLSLNVSNCFLIHDFTHESVRLNFNDGIFVFNKQQIDDLIIIDDINPSLSVGTENNAPVIQDLLLCILIGIATVVMARVRSSIEC